MEESFVPSYKNEEERLKIRKEKDKKYKIRVVILTIVIALVILVVGFLGYTILNINYSKYEKYEEKMDIYGFSQVYDDGDCNTRDKVTKSEAVKMILSCLYNVQNIEGIALPTEETYPNAIWVEYAVKQGIVTRDEVNASNADDKVKYQEVLVWLYNIKAKILNIEPDTEARVEVKDINAYNADQKLAVYDLINSEVITVNTKNINGNQKLYKGKLNELIVNFAEQYNTITVGSARININEDKIPENASSYPYTLASVQKDTYETPFINDGQEGFISPIELFKDNKQYYSQIKSYVENYYGYLVNINYENITVEQMKRKMKKYALDKFDDQILSDYVNYVKANKIKLTGTVVAQLPCIYFDGENYRVRTKIEFNVESSDTTDNLLYYDLENGKITYDEKQYTLYLDVAMSKNEESQTLFNKEGTIYSMLVKQNSGIVSAGD
ncbi:MAG: hypothetical protein J6A15_04950 [Clostridia bacterium]|nr:hypothetical protein [Clostridia bacterium]